ncbi:hypothetical protein BCR35DRAFT_333487 [Leucosporidium creatinivorum]|uniref:RING-type domain-containing protein n=1 Tax=Leucosporidium creatinivorum TaxID=106004 RepID=A0A1Y2ER33_9BASI|nr:hypothetical protein BCR35DRAFT_333487 [Leucosporidium creatinivorum]
MAGVGEAFALINLAREINCKVIATSLNQDRLRAVTGKVLSLTTTLAENQEALARLGANELDPVMDGLRAILDHSERLSRKMQKQGWAKRMFNTTEIEHAIRALEREIDTEMSTVNLVCNFVNHGNVHRMHHDLQSLRAEMMEQFSQLLTAHQETRASIAVIDLPAVAQPNPPEPQINEPLQDPPPPLTSWTSAPVAAGLHGSRNPAPPRPTITRGASAPSNGASAAPAPTGPARAQTQRLAPPSTSDSDDEFDWEAELARSKASAAATISSSLPTNRALPSAEIHPPTVTSHRTHLEMANSSDLDSDLDSEGDELWSDRAPGRYRPSAIAVALTLPPPPSNLRVPSPISSSSTSLATSTSPHPPIPSTVPHPPRIPSPPRRTDAPPAPVRPSTPSRVVSEIYDGRLHQSPERLLLPNLTELSISPPRPPTLSPQPQLPTTTTTTFVSQRSNPVLDVLQVEPDDQEEPLPAFTEFDPFALEEQEEQQQQLEASRAATSALEGVRIDSPARRTPVLVEGDYKPDEFDPSMLARPGQPEEICRMCANLLPMSEYPSARTTDSCTHPINICLDCMRGYLHEEVIEHGRALQVRCPIPMCGEYLSCDEFKRLADHFVFTAYCDIIDGRRLPHSRPREPPREFKSCPRELCGYIIERDGERGLCKLPDGCGAAFCWTCLVDFQAIIAHGNHRHRKTCTWYRPLESAHLLY